MITNTSTQTRFTTSADGTEIAYEVAGTGPAVVLVDGALCQRSMGPARGLAAALAGEFTVYAYDRRGRGESGPGATPYDIQREVEDLVAVIEATAGSAHVFGSSSGAALALEAACQGAPIDRICAYEAPFILDDSRPPNDADLPQRVQAMVDDGRRGDAVRTFMRTVGMPAPFVALMRLMPVWRKLTGVAHTCPTTCPSSDQVSRAGHFPPVGTTRLTPHARDRGRQESRLDAQRAAANRRRCPERPAGDPGRPNPHDQAESGRARGHPAFPRLSQATKEPPP